MTILKKRLNWANISRVPDDEFGVYAIWAPRRCVYVGQAKRQSLRKRLKDHLHKSHNEELNVWIRSSVELSFTVELVENKEGIDRLERLRISQYSPLTNIMLNNT